MENRSAAIIKLHAFQRYVAWYHLQFLFKNIRVTEFPKSGGTWLCQMLGELLALDFPRNAPLPMKKCIQHSHYPGPSCYKTIVVVRDGRDVLTSAYFHFLFYAPDKPDWLIEKWRLICGDCDFENVQETMPVFIEKFSNHFKVAGRRMNWSKHVMSFDF